MDDRRKDVFERHQESYHRGVIKKYEISGETFFSSTLQRTSVEQKSIALYPFLK